MRRERNTIWARLSSEARPAQLGPGRPRPSSSARSSSALKGWFWRAAPAPADWRATGPGRARSERESGARIGERPGSRIWPMAQPTHSAGRAGHLSFARFSGLNFYTRFVPTVHVIISTHTTRHLRPVLLGVAVQRPRPASVVVSIDNDAP